MVPLGITASAGVIWDMDVSDADVTVSVVLPVLNPKKRAMIVATPSATEVA